MIINSIMIHNFRCYYGESNLSFNTNGKLTLIYGDSGYGKSSLLQFFRWMLYNNPDFGKKDDKPLFNLTAFAEQSVKNKPIEVKGQIKFEHLGCKYILDKVQKWSPAFSPQKASQCGGETALQIDSNDGKGYQPYTGDILNLINGILPIGLSKYFLLDGERAREVVLKSNELKEAIQTLFGLDAYREAILHIGNSNTKYSVLGHYSKTMASQMANTINNASPSELQETLQDQYEKIEIKSQKLNELKENIEKKSHRKEEIVSLLGEASSKGNLKELIAANNRAIKEYENKILLKQHDIGNLFYKNFPYLFLAKMASDTSSILRTKREEYAANYKNVFENLKKPLMQEILEKNICVCGRTLDEKTKEYIEGIINIMPPGSYAYEFGQFVQKAKSHINHAQLERLKYEEYVGLIAEYESAIIDLEESNNNKLEDLKRFEEATELVNEYEELKKKISSLERARDVLQGEINYDKKLAKIGTEQLNRLIKNNKVSAQFTERIKFFEDIAKLLKIESIAKEQLVKETLNRCVRETFKKLTTQTELDANKIQFVNEDFSLRTSYLTGGQQAIDVYSYVIGIIKALQEFKMDNNETPIIVDAPFAFTGNTQSEHIFKTLPSVSKQTILLTLDLNKIKNLLKDTDNYEFYVIKNHTQEKATLERGNIDDIKF